MGRGKTRKETKSAIHGGAFAVVLLWIASPLGSIFFPVITIASGALAVFSLCRMPTCCCAERSRGGPCEGSTYGVFASCGEPAHADRKRALVRTRGYWAGLARKQYSGWAGAKAVYLAIFGTLSGVVALIITLAT
jgi:hypothetical protein